jgi:16S rRNA (guanine966-N2)-methyltransferase
MYLSLLKKSKAAYDIIFCRPRLMTLIRQHLKKLVETYLCQRASRRRRHDDYRTFQNIQSWDHMINFSFQEKAMEALFFSFFEINSGEDEELRNEAENYRR